MLLKNPILRNVLGFFLLAMVHYAADWYALPQRTGFNQTSPYLFLLLLYGWIVFHNRILFERLYLRDKKLSYALLTTLCMGVSTLNMHFTLNQLYQIEHTLPHILSFWVYTITGLGMYVMFRFLHIIEIKPVSKVPLTSPAVEPPEPTQFTCIIESARQTIPCQDILFIESLENYVKVNTVQKKHLVRLTLKEAEERLPKSFIRISKSHILNSKHITGYEGDLIRINSLSFRIGKVYKKYVEDQLRVGS